MVDSGLGEFIFREPDDQEKRIDRIERALRLFLNEARYGELSAANAARAILDSEEE